MGSVNLPWEMRWVERRVWIPNCRRVGTNCRFVGQSPGQSEIESSKSVLREEGRSFCGRTNIASRFPINLVISRGSVTIPHNLRKIRLCEIDAAFVRSPFGLTGVVSAGTFVSGESDCFKGFLGPKRL